MKKVLLLSIVVCLSVIIGYSQAKKPTLMVVPSDSWCMKNGYIMQFDNQGMVESLPDYNKALMGDSDLNLAISKIGEMMSERGFPLKDLGATMRSIRNDAVEESLTTSSDGDGVAESPLDRIKRVARADIWIQLDYKVNRIGPSYSLTFNIQGIDAYTNKQIAAASGTGEKTVSAEVPVLLAEAVFNYIEGFNSQLSSYFDNLFEQGREISLVCRRWSSSDIDFETEFDGDELGFIIEDWLAENTIGGRFSTSDASENRMFFEQVRIPMVNDRGRAIDARSWANDLRKMLRERYNIDAKLSIKGLGQAIITIGAK